MIEDNLSAVLHCPSDLRLEQTKIDEPKPEQVQVEIQSVGICGSDVHYLKCGRIGSFVVEKPMILGHESSGLVTAVGENVSTLKIGDRVAIEPGVPCKNCQFCLGGRYNLCREMQFCATPPFHGTLRRFYCHDASFCFKLPDHVTYEEAAMLEPLSVAVHACRRAGLSIGQKLLICGAGPIGLLTFLTAKAMGISDICITDIDESRLAFASKLGVKHAVRAKNNFNMNKEIMDNLEGQPDVTIECSGAEASIILGIKTTKSGGVMMLVGLGKELVTVPLVEAACREVDIKGLFRYANCYPVALNLVANGSIDVKPLITHHFTLEEVHKAFEMAGSNTSGAIKVMINCAKKC